MKKKRNKYILIITVILVIFLWMNLSGSREETIEIALDSYEIDKRFEMVDILDYSESYKLAVYVSGRDEIEAVGILKNMFGWKVSTSLSSEVAIRNIVEEGLGSILRTTEFLLGTYDGLEDYRVVVNGLESTTIKMTEHDYAIWYVKDLEDESFDIKFYNANDALIYEYTLE